MTARWWWLLAGLAGTLSAQAEPPAPDAGLDAAPRLAPHVVRAGETLWEIARTHLGRAQLWPAVRDSNGVGEPRQLQIGTVLQFAEGGADAVVVAASGDVRVSEHGGERGTGGAMAAMRVAKGALVTTGPDGFVTLRLPDGSLCTLPSNSSVRLLRFAMPSGQRGALLDLQAGEVESRVPPQAHPSGRDVFQVRTRIATVGVRGTRFRVSVTDKDEVAVSVLESRVVVQTGGLPEIFVSELEGAVVGGHRPTAAATPLLPAPELSGAGEPQNQPGVLLAWHEVDGASGYRAQIARDALFLDLVAEQRTARTGGRELALFEGIAPGSYFSRVAAVNSDGVEGRAAVGSFSRGVAPQSPAGGSARWLARAGAIEFEWEPVPRALHCLEIAEDPAFSRMIVRADGLQAHAVRVAALPPGQYYWRACAAVVAQGQRSVSFGPTLPLWVEGAR